MPANPDVSWWNATLWQNDGLYKEIAFGASGLQYFLGHHTFNHENLNAITYYDAVQQIRLNQVRRQLWPCYCALRTTGDSWLPTAAKLTCILVRLAAAEACREDRAQLHNTAVQHFPQMSPTVALALTVLLPPLQAAAAPWNTTNGKFNRFSQTAMVTPGISGFRNKDALQVRFRSRGAAIQRLLGFWPMCEASTLQRLKLAY